MSNTKRGLVSLIGAGPGDSGLITVKGLERIRNADIIIYDYLASPLLLSEAKDGAELIYVGKKGGDHTLKQNEINALIVEKAEQGKLIVRLKGGDPFVFGRGGEEAEELVDAGVSFEVVPGVTSAVAAPAYAGIPVTHRDHASMVTFITGHENPEKESSAIDWSVLAANPGTLVFLMGVKNLDNISASLITNGKPATTPASLVRWGTTPLQESLHSDLGNIANEARQKGFKAPAVLVVGGVAGLSDRLAWFETKPLFGKKIMITRAQAQSRGMKDRVSDLGADPVMFPTIKIVPPEDYGPLDAAIERAASYDWIVLTSVNGVERFFERYFTLKEDIRNLHGPRIGAIGPVTASSIRKKGLKVDLLAKEFKAEGLLAGLSDEDVVGKTFLIPRAEQAREILPETLKQRGATVDVVPVYRTVVPEDAVVQDARRLLETGSIDVVTFTSSSTVRHFAEMVGPDIAASLSKSTVFASIGPVTSQTMREHGMTVTLEARAYTIDGLVDAIVEHYSKS